MTVVPTSNAVRRCNIVKKKRERNPNPIQPPLDATVLYTEPNTPTPATVYFFPFFFFPDGVAAGVTAGVSCVSTSTGSSSLATLGTLVTLADLACSASSSAATATAAALTDSAAAWTTGPRRFSHHCFSWSTVSWISSRRSRRVVLAAISLADWKMIWPQLGARALACGCVSFFG